METESLKVLIPLAAATRLCGFEVQRWARVRMHGKRGSSEGWGIFVDLTSNLTTLAYLGWLILVGVKIGAAEAVVIGFASIVLNMLMALMSGGDRFWRWMLGLIGIWPLTIALYVLVL